MNDERKTVLCRCGCDQPARYFYTGEDYGGWTFVDEPACYSAGCYLEESAAELGLKLTKRKVPNDE